jgi:hypothetical protein
MREFHFSGLDGGKWVSGRRIMARRHGTMAAVGGAAVARDRGGGGEMPAGPSKSDVWLRLKRGIPLRAGLILAVGFESCEAY